MLKTSKVSQPSVANATCQLHPAKLLVASLIVLVACTTGCTIVSNAHKALVYNDSWSEAVTVLRNRNWSAKAWHKRKHHFCNERFINDFAAGFRQGYEDVANGSDGCTPATPPRQYWSWEFQSGEGQSRMGAWFAGYPQGARAAEEEGVGSWTQLQMSSGMQNQLKQAGMMSCGPIVGSSTVQPVGTPVSPQPVPMTIGEPTRVPMPTGIE
jgi:hypothetical protein